jgi:protein SCO1/2
MRIARLVLALVLVSQAALAALPPSQLGAAGVTLPRDAVLPLSFAAPDLAGNRRGLGEILAGRPGFVVFADYTCKALCGPALVLLSSALAQSGLVPDSYRLIVIGLDPKDTADDARRMLAAEVPEALRANAVLLRPDAAVLAAATKAAGFHYVYDKSVDQFAHPELAYVVDANGRIRRLLSPFALTIADLKSALFAPDPKPSFADSVRLICYRFGVLSGPYTAAIEIALKAGAALTVFALAGAVLVMHRKRRTAR